jgi:chromosome partitioning protein
MVNINDIRNQYKIDLEFEEDLSSINRQTNPKIIAFYAEKGGVGKTTISLTLAHMLAQSNYRVLLVDCDVQRSLTAWVFGTNIDLDQNLGVNKVDNFIRRLPCPVGFKKTLYEQVVDREGEIKPAAAIRLKENLYIVPGDRRIPDLDSQITNNEAISSDGFQLARDIPNMMTARPFYAIKKTADHFKIDYVFLDMNPYPGVLNRCLMMSSHYIVIPTCLDFFCVEMMSMMLKNLTEWSKITNDISESTKRYGSNYHWPNHSPKFLGFIMTMFNVNHKWEEGKEF